MSVSASGSLPNSDDRQAGYHHRRGKATEYLPSSTATYCLLDSWWDGAMAQNVLGGELQSCGTSPMTGFYRTGCCDTGADDVGVHTVCARVTEEFLTFSKDQGNDLSTPNPEHGFAGLVPGDQWCLCASRWAEAFDAGAAPPVVLEATHARTLEWIDLAQLRLHAADPA